VDQQSGIPLPQQAILHSVTELIFSLFPRGFYHHPITVRDHCVLAANNDHVKIPQLRNYYSVNGLMDHTTDDFPIDYLQSINVPGLPLPVSLL